VRIPLRHTHPEKVHQQLSVRQVTRTGDARLVARCAQQHSARALPDQQSVHSTRRRHGPHGRLSGPVLHGRGLSPPIIIFRCHIMCILS